MLDRLGCSRHVQTHTHACSAFEVLLKEDMRKNLKVNVRAPKPAHPPVCLLQVMAQLDLLPTVFGSDWSYLFLQVPCIPMRHRA